MKVYFKGCSLIEKPVDFHGKEIKVGDKLTWDFHCQHYEKEGGFYFKEWMKTPIFLVKEHTSGGFFGEGMFNELYLHDFRFALCEIIN